MRLDATNITAKEINEIIKTSDDRLFEIDGVLGERFIACGLSDGKVEIHGTPGNALGAYLDGAEIEVFGNGQDAVGDTMNDGKIVIHGSAGDAPGYAMRGGRIYVEGDAGYRIGVHMKEYRDKKPVIVIGGTAGSFLGEYQAGGLIAVLNRNNVEKPVGYFCGTGMHGGKIFLRCEKPTAELPPQVKVSEATESDMAEIAPYIDEYCRTFKVSRESVGGRFFVLTPNSSNPYRRLYVKN